MLTTPVLTTPVRNGFFAGQLNPRCVNFVLLGASEMPKMTRARLLSGVAALILMVLGLMIAFESGVSADPNQTANQGGGLHSEQLGF
jgi:hypothetical protein